MATTSIWAVKGWLGKVVLYIENPEKTENPQFYRQKNMTDVQAQNLSDVIDYAARPDKTTEALDSESVPILRQLVSGINCLPATARDEMLAAKKRFGKEDGIVAYHGYQSFAPGEATPELAHEIGVKLARKLWGKKYQVLVATHLDKENHLHNHFVVNTVSFIDGIRYHRTGKDYYEMRTVSDALCREYGLSVVEKSQPGKAKHYGEWRAEQEQRPTWRGLIRSDIDEAIRQAMTERQFFDALRKKGYAVKVGKDISVRPPGKERFVRLMRNFGEDYSLDSIRRRILSQSRPERKKPEQKPEILRVKLIGSLKTVRKLTGFRALYVHYCYLLGIFPKNRPQQSRKRMHFLLREDLLKLDAITAETRLLVGHRIDTAEQLFCYRDKVSEKITALTADRKQLYKLQRTTTVKSDPEKAAEVKAQIAALSKELAALRKEVVLCNSIAERSGVIQEKIKAVREDEQPERKEKTDHVQFR